LVREGGRGVAEKVKGAVRSLAEKTIGKVPLVGRLTGGNSSPDRQGRRAGRANMAKRRVSLARGEANKAKRLVSPARDKANKAKRAARNQHK
jgi:hypothetical protein